MAATPSPDFVPRLPEHLAPICATPILSEHWRANPSLVLLLIVGTFQVAPRKLAAAMPAMKPMIAASRQEDGCIAYAYAHDILISGLIRVHEFWRDEIALNHHFATTHIDEWRVAWPSLGISNRDLALHAVADGRPT